MTKSLVFTTLLIASTACPMRAEDWPQWGGPSRDHASKEKGLLQKWPDGGPKQLWVSKEGGIGYAGISVAEGRIYTMGARGDTEFLIALEAKNGKELWATAMGPLLKNGWGDGPRGTPTVSEGRVYSLSGKGTLLAADAKDGKMIWKKAMSDLGGKEPGWGYTESVLVENGMVYCTPGGEKGAIAAFDAKTGDLKWQSKDFTPEAQYASIVPADINGKRHLVQLTMKKLVAVDAKSGKVLWQTDYPGEVAVIPTPVVLGNKVYATAGYRTGVSKLIEIDAQNQTKEIYSNKVMVNHHGGVVLVGKHVYGFSENQRAWVCQDFATGEQVWTDKALGKGAVTYADGRLYCQDEGKGIVVLAEASAQGWKEHGRFTLAPQSEQRHRQGKIWTHPVIANGKLYLRDQELLSCFDVSSGAKTASIR